MNNSNSSASNGLEINIIYLLEGILKKWWLILLLTVSFALAGIGISKVSTTPTYTSKISFVVNAISNSSSDEATYNDINGSIKIANTFSHILSSRILYIEVVNDCKDYNLKEEELKNAVSVSTVEDTNVIEMLITTDSANKSKAIADSVMLHYSDVVKQAYPSIGLAVINPPVKAINPDTSNVTARNALIGAFLGIVIAVLIAIISNLAKATVREA
ncbi:MAG: hypothetical protein IIX39_03450, partial [Clostridia bacterium]|nr:hypothetical protein [Clostridia bacterium]